MQADNQFVTVTLVVVLIVVACLGGLFFSLVRAAERMPKTQEGWLEGAHQMSEALRQAVPEVAKEEGMHELAQRAASDTSRVFPRPNSSRKCHVGHRTRS
jgi:hypothetical protein